MVYNVCAAHYGTCARQHILPYYNANRHKPQGLSLFQRLMGTGRKDAEDAEIMIACLRESKSGNGGTMKKNILFALCIVALAGILALFGLVRGKGGKALVTIADGKSFSLSLARDGVYAYDTATGAKLDFTLEVSEGRVRFVNSLCPDHVCEGFGWLTHEGDQAICLPAGVVVTVE